MLTIETAPAQSDLTNKIAPDVFIDSVYIYSGSVRVNFHIEDPDSSWINNKTVLEGLNVHILYDDQEHFETLSSLKDKVGFKNNKLSSNVLFTINNLSTNVEAYCSNEQIIGTKTVESILINDNIPQAAYEDKLFKYINKIIDVRPLDVQFLYNVDKTQYTDRFANSIFISYNTNKHANLGYIFDLEGFLLKNSHVYRFFSKYNDYKQILLKNSSIDAKNISFFKKNISIQDSEYVKINSETQIVKFSDSGYKHFMSVTDKNIYPSDKSRYKIKLTIPVKDYSYEFFKKYMLDRVQEINSWLTSYKNKFEVILNNKLLSNPYEFFYQYEFEFYKTDLEKIIEDLSTIYSFISSKEKSIFYGLFLSSFHPLVTNIDLLNYTCEKIDKLSSSISKILLTINQIGDINSPFMVESRQELTKEFNHFNDFYVLDYNFDKNYGYEVIHQDNFKNRSTEVPNGIKIISEAEKNTRKILEKNKFVISSSQAAANNQQQSFYTTTEVDSLFPNEAEKVYLSFSSLDLGQKSTYLLDKLANIDTNVFNDSFLTLEQYNNSTTNIKYPESYYYAALENGVHVTTIDSQLNTAINNLQPTTLFDPNLDSQQESLEFIASTGVIDLYYATNKDYYIETTSDIRPVAVPSGSQTVAEYIFKVPSSKPRYIISYNNIFEDIAVLTGSNYSLYMLRPVVLNPMFDKKLKHFNHVYIVRTAENQIVEPIQTTYDFIDDLNYNILTKYLNRATSDGQLLLTTSDL